jgi:hypothetical protein
VRALVTGTKGWVGSDAGGEAADVRGAFDLAPRCVPDGGCHRLRVFDAEQLHDRSNTSRGRRWLAAVNKFLRTSLDELGKKNSAAVSVNTDHGHEPQ